MTPMLRQYLELKEQAGSALLLFRMGDFYEMFFEDAQVAAPVLGITLTRRRHNDAVEAPMCGVPHHAFDGYLGKLLDAGLRVAVAEQVEDPATAKGLVRREIIRTHTPGTVSSTDLLDGTEHCFLAAIGGDDESYALAWLELSTGTFEGMRCDGQAVVAEQLARMRPEEILVAEGWDGWREMWPESCRYPPSLRYLPSNFPLCRRGTSPTSARGGVGPGIRPRIGRTTGRYGRVSACVCRRDPERGPAPPEFIRKASTGGRTHHRPCEPPQPRGRTGRRWSPQRLSALVRWI